MKRIHQQVPAENSKYLKDNADVLPRLNNFAKGILQFDTT